MECYLQTCVEVMGSPVSGIICDLYMDQLAQQLTTPNISIDMLKTPTSSWVHLEGTNSHVYTTYEQMFSISRLLHWQTKSVYQNPPIPTSTWYGTVTSLNTKQVCNKSTVHSNNIIVSHLSGKQIEEI